MRATLLALAAMLLALPTTATAQHHEDGKAEIEAMAAKWQAAFNAGDGVGVAALYSDDAMLMPPNSAPVSGRPAIEAFWTQAASQGMADELTTKEVYAVGDMAVEIGMYSATAADGSHADHGHYMVVFKQENGQWKMYRDTWNSDMAP
jgi:uncharacterized protein (TIGR02246 family)